MPVGLGQAVTDPLREVDVPLQRLDPLPVVAYRTGPLALVALGLSYPAPQGFRRAADLRRDRADRCPYCEACSPSCSKTIRTARSRTSGEYFGDVCFVMMTPVSQEMGPPVNPARFIAPLKRCHGKRGEGEWWGDIITQAAFVNLLFDIATCK
jgi:hypothetical protein